MLQNIITWCISWGLWSNVSPIYAKPFQALYRLTTQEGDDSDYSHFIDKRLRLRELNLCTQGYPTGKWERQTTHLGLSAFQILFNTSHCSSKRQRAFQSPLSWARLGCLLHFPPHLPGRALPALVAPLGEELAGWLGFVSGWQIRQPGSFAFNAREWELCQTAERAS